MDPDMDPVLEVAIWQQKQRIQARIKERCSKRTRRKRRQTPKVNERAQAPTAGGPKTIFVISDSDDNENSSTCSDTTMEYPPLAEARPVAVPQMLRRQQQQHEPVAAATPIVPLTIQNLWESVELLPPDSLEQPQCTNTKCPYCTTPDHVPYMLQRINIMTRLLQLERELYGHTMHGLPYGGR